MRWARVRYRAVCDGCGHEGVRVEAIGDWNRTETRFAAALGLKINAMGGWKTSNLIAELGLRRSNELPLYLMLVGR